MAETKKIVKDAYLFRDGDPPDAMFIVRTGSFAITKTKGSSEIVLAEIKVGSMVGEMALFDRKPRSANVKALQDSEVIALPYDALEKQLESLPVWLKAILKNLNENLRESNKKIKMLENPNNSEDRFSPQTVNKLISILNFVSLKYGRPEEGGISVPSGTLRKYTIQIFGEATNKMQSMINALTSLGYFHFEELGEGRQKIINLKQDQLFQFVDWYNEWLFKQEKDRLEAMREDESKVLEGLMFFAKEVPVDAKGFRKVNLNEVQNDSMKALGTLLKVDDVNSLIEKKYLPEKVLEEKGVFVMLNFEELEPISRNWAFVNSLKKLLK